MKSGPPGSLFFFIWRMNSGQPERMEQDQATAIQQGAGAPTERFLLETGPAAEIAALAEPVLEDMGFRLVRVVMSKRDGATIQIMVDKAGGSIVVQDCADISRRLSPLLDVHDPVQGPLLSRSILAGHRPHPGPPVGFRGLRKATRSRSS